MTLMKSPAARQHELRKRHAIRRKEPEKVCQTRDAVASADKAIDGLFNVFSAEGGGSLSLGAFLRVVQRVDPYRGAHALTSQTARVRAAHHEELEHAHYDRIAQLFASIDTDGDGLISRVELHAALVRAAAGQLPRLERIAGILGASPPADSQPAPPRRVYLQRHATALRAAQAELQFRAERTQHAAQQQPIGQQTAEAAPPILSRPQHGGSAAAHLMEAPQDVSYRIAEYMCQRVLRQRRDGGGCVNVAAAADESEAVRALKAALAAERCRAERATSEARQVTSPIPNASAIA